MEEGKVGYFVSTSLPLDPRCRSNRPVQYQKCAAFTGIDSQADGSCGIWGNFIKSQSGKHAGD